MESHAQSVEDYLIEGLSFKMSPGASYVTSRRSVSFSQPVEIPTHLAE